CKNRQLQQRTTGEQVNNRVQVAGFLGELTKLRCDTCVIHSRGRDLGTDPVSNDHYQSENDLRPEIGVLKCLNNGGHRCLLRLPYRAKVWQEESTLSLVSLSIVAHNEHNLHNSQTVPAFNS